MMKNIFTGAKNTSSVYRFISHFVSNTIITTNDFVDMELE